MAKYMTTSVAARYLGMSKEWVRKSLDPALDNYDNVLKDGREYQYHVEDIEQQRKKLDKEAKLERKRTLNPEHLSPRERKKLAEAAYRHKIITKIRGKLNELNQDYLNIVERFTRRRGKTKYTGDGEVVKGISYTLKKDTEVNIEELMNVLPVKELMESGILRLEVDVKKLLSKGSVVLKEEIRIIRDSFKRYCGKNNIDLYSLNDEELIERASNFLRGLKSADKVLQYFTGEGLGEGKIKMEYLLPIFKDLRNKRLGENKMGTHSANIIKSLIKETFKPGYSRVTLTEEFESSSEKASEDAWNELDLIKRLYEMSKDLPVG